MKHHTLIIAVFALALSPILLNAQTHQTKSGVIITKENGHVRAFEPFRGTTNGGTQYTDVINRYQREMKGVRVYSMIVPTAPAFYCPKDAEKLTNDELSVIRAMYSRMNDSVTCVDAYGALMVHTSEPIYSRTDHHWSPLGAYYAAWEFARVAGVKWQDLSAYEPRTVHGYVGSMYRFSGRDAAIKADPEDFVYYVPRDSQFQTTYVGHNLVKNKVVSLTEPHAGPFFHAFKDGSSGAYCTFMGGDTNTTVITTGAKSGRRLLIIKDSFGNALPGYLFQAFDEICVTDFRYFQENIVDYARQHSITDLLIVNNMQHAYNPTTARGLERLLNQ